MLSSTQQQGDQSVVTRILLVDDDPHLVPLIQRGLAYEGFEVYTAMDGESGLAVARTLQWRGSGRCCVATRQEVNLFSMLTWNSIRPRGRYGGLETWWS